MPLDYRSQYADVLGHQIHYTEWGRADAPVVLVCHGHTRNCHSADVLAEALADEWRVICPDVIGRGISSWSKDPENEYRSDFYVKLLAALVDHLGIDRLAWIGTSMGGRLGLLAAAGVLRDRIHSFVINDMGPVRGAAVRQRIGGYMAKEVMRDTMPEMEAYFRQVYKPQGMLTDAQWRRFAETSSRRLPDGRFTTLHDPRVADELIQGKLQEDMWPEWDRIVARTLVLRGIESDVLLPQTADEMTRRGPKARLAVIPGCGHTPALNVPEQIGIVRTFLGGG
ncbi:alpha/beta fold hydrolase [Ramlibacter sp.]|uniref:alpha/beta fold hydrolase n=1 Tax=Ramlibacter sp. TaxID=1917967 RepID=UPI003D11643A